MKGDKKGLRSKRLVYEMSLNEEFNAYILEQRKRLGIPLKGFIGFDEMKEWQLENLDRSLGVLTFDFDVQKRFGISPVYFTVVEQYLFFASEKIKVRNDPKIVIDNTPQKKLQKGTLDEFYTKMGIPFAKVYILGGSTPEQIVDEIRSRWNEIYEILGIQGHEPQRVMDEDEKNQKRDALIWELSLKSREELGLKKGTYKEEKISQILKEKHGVFLGTDSIKSILKNQKKLRLGKLNFKF